jgi:hypothetical protein
VLVLRTVQQIEGGHLPLEGNTVQSQHNRGQ